ncbi:MAG TPA: ATP-binding protein [Chloroflexia bacterium]|nr:ATP-binding protein [Chloroflexia bacterium]
MRLLHLAASTSEGEVEAALTLLLEQGAPPAFDAVRELAQPATLAVPALTPAVFDLGVYDRLLAGGATMPDRHAELLAMLHTLKLPAMADTFADLALKAAKGGLTHEAFLYELVCGECEQRDQRRTARLLRQSGLPAEKTFRTLQLARFPSPSSSRSSGCVAAPSSTRRSTWSPSAGRARGRAI